jgi:hypothetical protein
MRRVDEAGLVQVEGSPVDCLEDAIASQAAGDQPMISSNASFLSGHRF